jgi:hypothetical protein
MSWTEQRLNDIPTKLKPSFQQILEVVNSAKQQGFVIKELEIESE